MKLSENLKLIRKENNLSQEQLAEQLGVTRQSVSKWESGTSYPEMEKVLLICKLYNFNIDELLNENMKENPKKENKILKKSTEYFTSSIEMFIQMTFKQKVSFIIEQFLVILFLYIVYLITTTIARTIILSLDLPFNFIVNPILSLIVFTFKLIVIAIILIAFLYTYKIRYLDYYQKKEPIKEKEEKSIKEEKVIIRDPKDTPSGLIKLLTNITIIFMKFIALCISLGFIITFIGLITLLISSFIISKSGLLFISVIILILSLIIGNYIILEILYKFITDLKQSYKKIGFVIIISMILFGIGSGLTIISTTQLKIIKLKNDTKEIIPLDGVEHIYGESKITYIESTKKEQRIEVEYNSLLYLDYYLDDGNYMGIYVSGIDYEKINELSKLVIEKINNKEMIQMNKMNITVYAPIEKINELKGTND